MDEPEKTTNEMIGDLVMSELLKTEYKLINQQEKIEHIQQIQTTIKIQTYEWFENYRTLRLLSGGQRDLLKRFVSLLLIQFGSQIIENSSRIDECCQKLRVYLRSPEAFCLAKTLVEDHLPRQFDYPIWLPAIHRTIVDAKTVLGELLLETV